MALTDATRLADFSSGVGTDGTLSANNINATGIVTAATLKLVVRSLFLVALLLPLQLVVPPLVHLVEL